jgi:hypothetical protein
VGGAVLNTRNCPKSTAFSLDRKRAPGNGARMDVSQIKDRKTLQAWLEARPQKDAIAIAHRDAVRQTGRLYESASFRAKWNFDRSAITLLRCLLTSAAAHNFLTPEVVEATKSATFNARDTADAADDDANYISARTAVYAARAAGRAVHDADAASVHASAVINSNSGLPIDSTGIWQATQQDAIALESGLDPLTLPLWHTDTPPDWFTTANAAMHTYWRTENPTHWSFWLRWYDAAIAGTPLDWQLQHAIALIPNNIWKSVFGPADAEATGPGAVAEAIAKIEAAHENAQKEPSLETQISRLPTPSASQIATTQAAMQHNRSMLPPTFDAIEGLILLEIERLQRLNFKDDLDQAEAHRQIRILTTLYEAICALRDQLPEIGPVTEDQAKTSVSLVSLYGRKFADLPRTKVDEVIDGAWSTGRGILQAGLIGTTTIIGVAYGLPALAAVTIGAMVFAPKNAADLVKAARETLSPKP